ncbi:MAG TPA: hypothetical protein VF668_17810, partial [Pyrinomonadaceae bacterium]
GQYVDLNKFVSQEFLAERLKGVSGAIASRTLGFVGGFVGFVVEVFFVIFAILVPLTLLTFAVVGELTDFAQMLQPNPDGTGGAARC